MQEWAHKIICIKVNFASGVSYEISQSELFYCCEFMTSQLCESDAVRAYVNYVKTLRDMDVLRMDFVHEDDSITGYDASGSPICDAYKPAHVQSDNPYVKKGWDEFRSTGLFLFLNQFLHLFGWCIVITMDADGNVSSVYPARTCYRGHSEASMAKAYENVAKYMAANADALVKESVATE